MTAAALTAVTRDEVGSPGVEVIHGTVAASGDFFISKFGTITGVVCTPSVAQVCAVTWSGSVVTVLTAAADVTLVIYGY